MATSIARLEIEQVASEATGQGGTEGFFVFSYQWAHLQKHLRRRMRLNSYMLALCVAGWVRVRVNGEEMQYGPGTCSAFVPATVHEILDASADYTCQAVVFRPDFLLCEHCNRHHLESYQLFAQPPAVCLQLAAPDLGALAELFAAMQRTLAQFQHPFRDSILRSQAFILLGELEHRYRQQRGAPPAGRVRHGKEKLLDDFRQLVQAHFTRQHAVGFYASRLAVTPTFLSALLKAATGKTAKELLAEARLTEARLLLQSGRYTVSETAGLLGYANLEVFCRFFKNNAGRSALKFRRQPAS